MPDKRYRIRIDLTIEDTTGPAPTPFYDCPVTYHDAPVAVVLAVEKVLLKAQGELLEMGFQKAASESKGT